MLSLYRDALEFAAGLKEPLNSFHLLLALFTTKSDAAELLHRHMISTATVSTAFKRLRATSAAEGKLVNEPAEIITTLNNNMLEISIEKEKLLAPMNFLFVITATENSLAYRLLETLGVVKKLHTESGKLLGVIQPDASQVRQKSPETMQRRKEDSKATKKGDLPELFTKFGRNLTEMAKKGQLDYAWGREDEQETIIDILGRRRNNNPLIIGAPGTGKTALVEGIAARQQEGLLPGKVIWELQLALLIGGTNLRGALEERVMNLLKAVEERKDKIVVFIDEIHLINSDGNEQLANLLKPALARGTFPLIGATTVEEFNTYIAKDQAMERRFTLVKLSEPSGEKLTKMVMHAATELTAFHGVKVNDSELVETAINLSNRYISGRSQPDKVISLLDTLGAILKRENKKSACKDDIIALVSNRTDIPEQNLLIDSRRVISDLPLRLSDVIIGQNPAKRKIVQLLGRRFAAGNGKKPIASFLFAGPTGTGKSETARILAQFFYGSRDKMVVLDMSEFQEQHTISRLIGSPPGYVGHEDGGQLTEAFRREPYQLLLLDEIEKAHPKILTLLLQMLEEGRVTDSRGFRVSFSETIIVLTTNLGAETLSATPVGFSADDNRSQSYKKVLQVIEQHLSPELLNRIDEVAVFDRLTESELTEIAELFIQSTVDTIVANYAISVTISDASTIAKNFIKKMSRQEQGHGARGVLRRVEKGIEEAVMNRLTDGESSLAINLSPGEDDRPIATRI
ncbi:ATP-dependent Clp protease ATP-binding subunit [bacterium]|nr:ATP-dependent Clp protease ATP-binding subunit [bacterium]